MKNLLFLVVIWASLDCQGQLPDYYVYLVKGDVATTKNSLKSVRLNQNNFLYKSDIINLKEGAELTLVDRDQNFFVIISPGMYHVKDLAKGKPEHLPGVTQKYLKLVWNELLNPSQDFTKFSNSNIAGAYGGVSRTDLCNNLIFPSKGLRTSVDSLHFSWLQTSPVHKYALLIYNNGGKEILNIPVNDTEKIISTKQNLTSQPGNYYWLVKGENANCEDDVPSYFEILTPENEQLIVSSLVTAKGKGNLLDTLMLIDKLEKKSMIIAAMKYYSALIKTNSANDPLIKSYVLFLLKYGYDVEAQNVWNMVGKKE